MKISSHCDGLLEKVPDLMTRQFNLRTCAIGCAALVGLAAQPAFSENFRPHRAAYDLKLKSAEGGSGISALTGKMVFEVRGSECEGYTVDFRLITEISTTAGETRLTDVRTSSFEDGAGQNFQFMTQTFFNQKLNQESRGTAIRGDGGLKVVLKKPEAKEIEFDGDLMFPSQHFFEVIRMAQAGQSFLSAKVYDGSEEGDIFFETATVIGKPRDIVVPQGEPETSSKQHWPVVITYYDPLKDQTDATPIYTLRFLTNAPGVSRDLNMDYNSFVMQGKLADLTLFPMRSCD